MACDNRSLRVNMVYFEIAGIKMIFCFSKFSKKRFAVKIYFSKVLIFWTTMNSKKLENDNNPKGLIQPNNFILYKIKLGISFFQFRNSLLKKGFKNKHCGHTPSKNLHFSVFMFLQLVG